MENEGFLIQTAKDYDLDLEVVKEVFDKCSCLKDCLSDFYYLLENKIKDRVNA